MLTISVDPVAFTIGSHDVRWYGIMVAIAVGSLLAVTVREAKRIGIATDIYSIFLCGIIGGVIGGRLAHVIQFWDVYTQNPLSILNLSGLAQNGMIIGVIVAALIYMAVTRMRFSELLRIGDAVAVGTPLAIAIARIGCTLNGCCHGKPSPFEHFPGAILYTTRDTIPRFWDGIPLYQNGITIPLYPTQIYAIWLNLIVFAIVWRFRDKFRVPGGLAFFYFSLHSAADFGFRFFRATETFLFGLHQAQVIDLAVLAVFLPWLIIRMRRSRSSAPEAEVP